MFEVGAAKGFFEPVEAEFFQYRREVGDDALQRTALGADAFM